ncbi:cation transporter [cyanobacterium TDX16]|nr:cation transporter [cyanobacterium TDX16]
MTRLLWIVLGLRVSLFLMELLVGLWSDSLSLLAGAGHVFSDLITLGLTLSTAYLVERKSSNQKDFRYRQLEIWVALSNSLSLMAIAFSIVWETVTHLPSPELEPGLPVLFVAGLGLAINSLNIYLLHNDSHHDLNVRGVFLHGIADAASSLGVMLSTLAIYYWHWLWADAIASLFVASLICLSAISLWQDSLKALRKHTCKPADVGVRITDHRI